MFLEIFQFFNQSPEKILEEDKKILKALSQAKENQITVQSSFLFGRKVVIRGDSGPIASYSQRRIEQAINRRKGRIEGDTITFGAKKAEEGDLDYEGSDEVEGDPRSVSKKN